MQGRRVPGWCLGAFFFDRVFLFYLFHFWEVAKRATELLYHPLLVALWGSEGADRSGSPTAWGRWVEKTLWTPPNRHKSAWSSEVCKHFWPLTLLTGCNHTVSILHCLCVWALLILDRLQPTHKCQNAQGEKKINKEIKVVNEINK